MAEILRVQCFSCESVMKIRADLAGRAAKCPACGAYFIVPKASGVAVEPSLEMIKKLKERAEEKNRIEVKPEEIETIHPVEHPHRLNPENRYVILDSSRLVAYWQTGKGWQVPAAGKLVPARRQPDLLPKQGDFTLVELQLNTMPEGIRLTGMQIFKLARQYSVTRLAGDEFAVLETITGHAGLLRPQKMALLETLRKYFMRETWSENKKIYAYLTNFTVLFEES
ncbi:MAG: hypothetical protein Q4D98_01785 [Planctomycetia bacterium]|nr:hypothetical protein [Planctomycetia bacterium]